MADEITEEEQTLIDNEIEILAAVTNSLRRQIDHVSERLLIERGRARDLTSELVAASRDEDKAMLASDEAVSHSLLGKREGDIKILERLVKNPYFARFVVEEELNGHTRELEYKLGFAANSDCRIIDWRRAPVSKLYYEYREGELYAEEIQGREREGTVLLRNSVEISDGELVSVTCRLGTFLRDGETWTRAGGPGQGGKKSFLLKNILPLITPEQFRTITEDAQTAILIQGIAGSGKTTVALHRLAWLLHEDNAALNPQRCCVLVLSNILKAYISQTLPSMGIHDLPVLTYTDWTRENVRRLTPQYLMENGEIGRPQQPTPLGIVRLTTSMAFLTVFEQTVADLRPSSGELALGFNRAVQSTLTQHLALIEHDETKLLTPELISEASEWYRQPERESTLDNHEEALLLRYLQIQRGDLFLPDGVSGKLEHLVVDEVQDLSAAQLATTIESVSDTHRLTLVGDTAQQTHQHQLRSDKSEVTETGGTFPVWERLRNRWALKDEIATFISLEVSHRSTYPIMKLADHIQNRNTVKKGRTGRKPIWFHTRREEQCLSYILQWLQTGIEKYPHAMTAVICASPKEAKYTLSLLEPTFHAAVRIGDNHSFSFEEGIVVTDVRSVKGLEFTNVLLWNASASSYPANQLGQNLLYIAATRAEENLAITTWGRTSKFLPHIHSKLVRGYDFTEKDEE